MQTSTTTRDAILKAANQVVMESGVTRLTLEAVAQAAGVIKGGLLYHFPSKEALIKGMIEQMNASFNASIRQAYEADQGPAQGRWLRAFIRATFTSEQVDLAAGLLAALALNPALLAPNRINYQTWQKQIEADVIDPAMATIIRLAVDGLWFSEVLDFAPPQHSLREAVLNRLIEMTSEGQAG
jgi:AcrR family transcriptional regulator